MGRQPAQTRRLQIESAGAWFRHIGFTLFDGDRIAQMGFFHGHPAAAAAGKLHYRQLVFADVLGVYVRSAAETAFFGVSARIAQVPRGFCHGAAAFTCIGHNNAPFLSVGVRQFKNYA
jgi:hypothetical protein